MTWMPCSGLDESGEMPWVPRLIEKARRFAAGRASGRDLMCGYLYGDNDFIDKQVLAFLKTDDTAHSALVSQHADDTEVARILIERAGRTEAERRAFGKKLRRSLFNFVMTEADEGRLPKGLKSNLIRFAYNRLVMPLFYPLFFAAERKRNARKAVS